MRKPPYADTYLRKPDEKWLSLAPSLGVGMDMVAVRGLQVGLYGGFAYNFYAEGFDDPTPNPATEPFFSGDVRLTLLYVFGS